VPSRHTIPSGMEKPLSVVPMITGWYALSITKTMAFRSSTQPLEEKSAANATQHRNVDVESFIIDQK
jgi:hypothetical protein